MSRHVDIAKVEARYAESKEKKNYKSFYRRELSCLI